MSLNSTYKNLLFLNGHFTDPRMDDGFGPTYGNRKANARTLRETWQPAREAVARAVAGGTPDDGACRQCANAA
jgi:hypothetical protein